MNVKTEAYVEIIEQPAKNRTRFRYECEGKYKANVHGASGDKKSYPTIRVVNYHGPVSVIVSCVTSEPPYMPHPHKLAQANKMHEHGACLFHIPANLTDNITFNKLSIQCCAKKDIEKSLEERQTMLIDPFKTGFDHKMTPRLIDLNSLRLCFQVFLENPDLSQAPIPLTPVVSDPIYDKKAVSELKICWLSHNSASAAGGTSVCILCEKVSKNDVQVLFSTEDGTWEASGTLVKPEVFKQMAIVFKTPRYMNPESVVEPINVQVRLRRISNGELSEPRPFQILPTDTYERFAADSSLKRKRFKYKSDLSERLQAELASNSNLLSASAPMTCSTGIIEPWELPPVTDYPYLQPQLNNANINEPTLLNIPLTNKSADTLQSDSWIKDLQAIICEELNEPEANIVSEPEIRYINPETATTSYNMEGVRNVNVMNMDLQQLNNFHNNNQGVAEEVARENTRESVAEFFETLNNLYN